MGFWHTGYMEFHEPVGLGDSLFKPSPPSFRCKLCDDIYHSINELRQHRFEKHPLQRPILFVYGRELGTHPIRITQHLTEHDVYTDNCDQAFLNGHEISVCTVPLQLSQISSGVYKLVLRKTSVEVEFILDFRIASEDDLKGVETQFETMARGCRLEISVIDEFICATKPFGTAIGYCDGICEYLYGVLAKERAPDATLPYESYVGKFNKAAEALSVYKRPLAQTMCALIAFHYNHFEEAAYLASKARVGCAAKKYATWMQGRMTGIEHKVVSNVVTSHIEALVTDWKTEQIIRWSNRPLDDLTKHVAEMESFLKREIDQKDGVKVHILLGEIYAKSGDFKNALKHAKILRSLPPLEKWTESMIRTYSEEHHE